MNSVTQAGIAIVVGVILVLSGAVAPAMGTGLIIGLDDSPLAQADAEAETPTIIVENKSVGTGNQTTVNLTLTRAPEGLAGYELQFGIDDSKVARISGIFYNPSFQTSITTPSPINESTTNVELQAGFFNSQIDATEEDIPLATVKINGTVPGSIPLAVTPTEFTAADTNDRIQPATETGKLVVSDSGQLPSATLKFNNQTLSSRDAQPTVARVTIGNRTQPTNRSYVVVAHETTPDGSIGTKIGESTIIDDGEVENISINISKTVSESDSTDSVSVDQTLVAVLHRANVTNDSNINHGTPVIRNGSTVADRAQVVPIKLQVSNGSTSGGQTTDVTVELSSAPSGLSGYNITIETSNESVASIVSAEYPPTLNLTEQPVLGNDNNTVRLRATDLKENISATTDSVQLAEVTVVGDTPGSTGVIPTANKIDGEEGFAIDTISTPGVISITESDRRARLTNISIAGQGAEAEIVGSADADVSVDVSNVGEVRDNFNVTAEIETTNRTLTEQELSVTILGGETERISFDELDTSALDTRNQSFTVTVSTANETLSGSLNVIPERDIIIQRPTDIIRNDPFDIRVVDQNNNPIVNATVIIEQGNRIQTTNETGNATLTARDKDDDGQALSINVTADEAPAVREFNTTVFGPGGEGQILEPASVTIEDVTIQQDQVISGENATVIVNLTNTGDVARNETVEVSNTTTGLATRTVEIAGNSRNTVAIPVPLTTDERGVTQSLSVNGIDSGTIDVRSAVAVTNLEVSPQQVEIGENVTVEATVLNRRSEPQTANITILVNGNQTGVEAVSIPAPNTGESSSITETIQTLNFNETGAQTISLDGAGGSLLDNQTVIVNEQPVPLNLDVNTTSPVVNETVQFTVTRTDTGDTTTATVSANGDSVQTESNGLANLSFNESGQVTVIASKDPTTTTVFENATQILTVNEPANVTIENAELAQTQARTNEDIQIVIELKNRGEVAGTREIQINETGPDGETLATENVTLSADSEDTLLPTVAFETAGNRNLSVEGIQTDEVNISQSIEVADAQPSSEEIQNDSTVSVRLNVENRGPEEDTRTLNVIVGDESRNVDITVPAGQERTIVTDSFGPFETGQDVSVVINGTERATVEVVEDVINYRLQANGSRGSLEIAPGDPVEFTISSPTGSQIEGVPIEVSGTQVKTTQDGTARLDPDILTTPGTFTARTNATDDTSDVNQGTVDIVVQQPAEFTVTDANVQAEAVTNETIPVTTTVENTGDLRGTTDIAIFSNNQTGSLNGTQLTLNGSEERDFQLNISFENPNTQTIRAVANNSSEIAGDVEIQPAIVIDDVSVSSGFVSVSENFNISVTLENQASTNRSNVPVNLSISGERRSDVIDPGGTTTLEFTQALATAGTRDIIAEIPRFGDESVENAGVVSVSRQSLALNIIANDTQITNDSSVTFTTTVAGSSEPISATVSIGGQTLQTDSDDGTVSTEINETGTFTTRVTKQQNATTAFRSDTTAIRVVEPATFEILSAAVENDETPIATEPVDVTATVLNTGDVRGNVTLNLTTAPNGSVSGTVRANTTTTAEIDAGSVRDIELNVTFEDPSTPFLRVNGTDIDTEEIGVVTIEQPIIITQTRVTPRAVTATDATSETLVVSATLENRATTEQTRNIEITIGENQTTVSETVTARSSVTRNLLTQSFDNVDRLDDPDRSVTIATEDAGQITLANETQQLDLTPNVTTLAAGDPIRFTITANGAAETATIEVAGQTLTTNTTTGTVTTTIPANDSYLARASKAQTGGVDFADDTVEITITDPLIIENIDNLAFGNASANLDGDVTSTAEITLRNRGGRAVNVGGVTIRGADADGFEVVDAPSSVAPDSEETITVEFSPTRRADFDAELRFRTDTPQQPRRTIDITGNGTAPRLRLSTQSVSFTDTDVGKQNTNTVTIANDGTEAVELTLPANNPETPFATNRSGDTLSITPGSELNLRTIFTPEEPAQFGEQLTIDTNSSFTSTVSLSLSGTGLDTAIDVDQSFDFGELVTGERTNGRILITNNGTQPVTLTPTVKQNSNGFVIESAQLGSDISLDPGESQFLSVSATQTQITDAEEATAAIQLESQSGDLTRDVSLTAELLEPNANIVAPETEPISFGGVAVGSTQSRGVTIENTGEAPLRIAQQNTFSIGSPFRLFGQLRALVLNPQVVIRPGETATVPVFFTPTGQNEATGTARLITNDPGFGTDGTRAVTVNGQGIQSDLTANQSSITFGERGNRSETTQSVILENQGNAPLSNLNLTLRGSNPAEFNTSLQDTSLSANAETTLTLTYEPSQIASHTAQVELIGESPSGRRVTSSISVSGTATPPDVSDLPARVQFGFVPESGSAATTETIAVENLGASSTRLDITDVTRSDTENFSINNQSDSLGLISGGAAEPTEIDIEFDPQQPGPISTTLTVETNDPDADEQIQNITLTGTGAAPAVEVNQTTVDFGAQSTNQTSNARVIGVTNDGSAPLDVTGVSTGDNSDFTADVSPQTVVPGGTVPVTVTTTPESAGIQNGILTVNTENIADSTVELQTRGIKPELTVRSGFANGSNFGGAAVGSSAVQRLTLNNTGNDTLQLSNLRTTNDAFSIVGSQGSINLTTGESTTIGVSFAPESEGQLSGTVEIDTNDPTVPTGTFTQSVSGTGLAPPEVSLNQTIAEFGTVAVESKGTNTLSITNDGDLPANITSVQIVGADTTAFDVRELGTISLSGGESEPFIVETSPTVTGSATATLEVTTGRTTLTTTLGVTGTEPDIELSTQTLTIDQTRLGTTTSEELQITNAGNAPLNVSAIQLVNVNAPSGQFFINDEAAETAIPAKATETLAVRYAPSVTDVNAAKNAIPRNASVRIQSNDPDDPSLTVDVEATSQTAELTVQRSLRFGLLRIGSETSKTLTIRNDVTATASLNLTETSVAGPNSDVFAATDPNVVGPDQTEKTELAPGEAAEVTVTLRPEQTGTQTATFILQTDDPRQGGRAVFLSNTQTIGFSTFGSVSSSFENIDSADLPVLPSVGATITDGNNARITQATPAVQTTQPINITFEGAEAPLNNTEQLPGVDAIRYVDIQTENLSDTTFVNNTIKFSVAKTTLQNLPNAGEDDVELYQYNGTTGEYEPLDTSAPTDNGGDVRYAATYTDIDRDLMIAVGAPEISLQPDTVTAPDSVTVGETVDVTATVANAGNVSGDVTVELRNQAGTALNSTSVTVGAGNTEDITLSAQLNQIGNQTLIIKGPENSPSRTVTALAQEADISLQPDSVTTPDSVTASDTVDVTATVANAGDVSGNVTIELKSQAGTALNSTSVTVGAGNTEDISLSAQLGQVGDQTLIVEGPQNNVNRTITIEPQPANVSIQPDSVRVKDPDVVRRNSRVEISVIVRNTGGESGNITLNLTRNGTIVNSETVSVSTEDTQNETLGVTLDEFGPQNLSINGQPAGIITVGRSSIILQNATVNATSITRNNVVLVNTTVNNSGSVSGSDLVTLTVNNNSVQTKTINLPANQGRTVQFQTRLTETGDQTLRITTGNQTLLANTVDVNSQETVSDPGGETGTQNDGFGVITALIALLAIALAVRRVDSE